MQLRFDQEDGGFDPVHWHDEMLRRINVNFGLLLGLFAGQRIDDRQVFDLVAPQLDAKRKLLVRRPDFDDVAPCAKLRTREFVVVAFVVNVDQLEQQFVSIDLVPDLQRDHHVEIVFRRTQTVNATHAGDDDDVSTTDERACRQQPQPVDLFVDRRIFLDVDVPRGDVRLRLVVVVVAHEVRHGVVREELFEFAVELSGQRFVVRQDERRTIHLSDDVGHRERLAGSGNSQQNLIALAFRDPADEFLDRRRLITSWCVVTDKFEVVHKMRALWE